MVHREDVVAVGFSGNRGGHAFSEVVDHAVEIERDDGEQVVARASDRACFDRVGREANPGSVEQRRESLGLAKVVEEARVGLRRFRQMSACVPLSSRTIASHPARGWLYAASSANNAIGSAMYTSTCEKTRASKLSLSLASTAD